MPRQARRPGGFEVRSFKCQEQAQPNHCQTIPTDHDVACSGATASGSAIKRQRRNTYVLRVHHADRSVQKFRGDSSKDTCEQIAHLPVGVIPSAKQDQSGSLRHAECQEPSEIQVRRDDDSILTASDIKLFGV